MWFDGKPISWEKNTVLTSKQNPSKVPGRWGWLLWFLRCLAAFGIGWLSGECLGIGSSHSWLGIHTVLIGGVVVPEQGRTD